jgi:phosphatidylglycerophosphate synthase
MLAGLAAGAALWATGREGLGPPALWFGAAALLMPLRLLANMLDGMVAVEFGKVGPTGELYNDVPDRVSDTAVLVGAGYAAGSSPLLGVWAALMAMFVTYVRTLGRSTGLPSDFRGPMAKPHRMMVMIAACILAAVLGAEWPRINLAAREIGVIALALWIVIAGCLITALHRLIGIARGLHARTKGTLADE